MVGLGWVSKSYKPVSKLSKYNVNTAIASQLTIAFFYTPYVSVVMFFKTLNIKKKVKLRV